MRWNIRKLSRWWLTNWNFFKQWWCGWWVIISPIFITTSSRRSWRWRIHFDRFSGWKRRGFDSWTRARRMRVYWRVAINWRIS
jgi:hypothetical protein